MTEQTQNMRCRQCDPDLVGALRKLLAYANKYSDSMEEHGFGASELGKNADSTSVAAMARIAINREEQWQHFDRMQQRVMADTTTRDEYFSQPEKEQDEFYSWMLKQCGELSIYFGENLI